MKKTLLAIAFLLSLTASASATLYTNVQVHSLTVGADTYKLVPNTGPNWDGTNIGVTIYSGTQISAWYDGACVCYHIPLNVLNYVSGYGPSNVQSVKVFHLSVNLPRGQELTIEILD